MIHTTIEQGRRVVAVSGGFDPVHIGHVRMFNHAKALGDYLVVLVNNDNWLRQKKGYSFMPEQERAEVIQSFAAVDEVRLTSHASGTNDMTVCNDLQALMPDIFANGGDRKEGTVPEYDLCRQLGIAMAFNIGEGGKVQSSSDLVALARQAAQHRSEQLVAAEEGA